MESDHSAQEQYEAEEYRRKPNYGMEAGTEVSISRYDVPSLPQYTAERKSGLEKRVDEPFGLINADRKALARLRIDMLASQLDSRRYIHEQNLDGLENDEMVCRNEMHKHEAMWDHDGAEKIRLGELLKVQKERRDLMTSYVRDTARLNKDLIDAVIEYRAITARDTFLHRIADGGET